MFFQVFKVALEVYANALLIIPVIEFTLPNCSKGCKSLKCFISSVKYSKYLHLENFDFLAENNFLKLSLIVIAFFEFTFCCCEHYQMDILWFSYLYLFNDWVHCLIVVNFPICNKFLQFCFKLIKIILKLNCLALFIEQNDSNIIKDPLLVDFL